MFRYDYTLISNVKTAVLYKKKQFWLNQSTDRTVVGHVIRLVPKNVSMLLTHENSLTLGLYLSLL